MVHALGLHGVGDVCSFHAGGNEGQRFHGGSARLQINWSKQGKLLKFDLKTPKITGEYQQLTLEGVIPEGAENGLLIITSPGGGMYIDDLDYRIGE